MATATERLSRPQAIERIRETLSSLEDDESCACSVAVRYGILCRGFAGLSDPAFRDRFHWIARSRPGASREELEKCVAAYHVGRQQLFTGKICCDLETRDHCACDGWNQFDNAALEKFCFQITGQRVSIG